MSAIIGGGCLGSGFAATQISTDTLTFEELPGGKTKITAQSTFNTLEGFDGMLQSGMESGAIETWDRLEELVTKA